MRASVVLDVLDGAIFSTALDARDPECRKLIETAGKQRHNVAQLCAVLGLRAVPKPAVSLDEYVGQRYGNRAVQEPTIDAEPGDPLEK